MTASPTFRVLRIGNKDCESHKVGQRYPEISNIDLQFWAILLLLSVFYMFMCKTIAKLVSLSCTNILKNVKVRSKFWLLSALFMIKMGRTVGINCNLPE